MKLLKYIIFLSILISIFLTISRESESKGLRGLWRLLKMSIVMAAALSGLIPIPENKEGSYRINSTQS